MAVSAPAPHTHTGASKAAEDYAKAIYALQGKAGGRPVTTSQLAARLHVTPGSASAMVKKLAELGLVEHTPYKGVALTGEGERLALEVLRHHRRATPCPPSSSPSPSSPPPAWPPCPPARMAGWCASLTATPRCCATSTSRVSPSATPSR